MWPVITVLLFSLCTATKASFSIDINDDDSYTVSVNGKVWLKSAPTFYRANRQFCTTANGTLKLLSTSTSNGTDVVGNWKATHFLYMGSTRRFQTSIYIYTPLASLFTYNQPPEPFVLFKQTYVDAVNATMAQSHDEVIAGFPGFLVEEPSVPLGYLSYGGSMFGDSGKGYGQFGTNLLIQSGITSGPLAIFDREKTANTLIISPASAFMATSLWQQTSDTQDNLYWGLMGGISDVWPGFETSTIMFYSNQGINKGFISWGQVMQKWYGRDNSFTKSDFTNNYLGYWTDNGAYYYYKTEPQKTYEETMVDVAMEIKQTGIPFRYLQYDSWWYPKDNNGGVETWTSLPTVFPDGLQWVFNKTGLLVSAHNRYWSSKTQYAKQNGGKYYFIIEGSKALPVDANFWDDLLSEARKWGLVTYEQDWLNVEFAGVPSLEEDLTLGSIWLRQMGDGAAKNGLTIQYCMSNCRHILQGIAIPAVTQARASGDYHPGKEQWRIGLSSVFAAATGIAPFKDNFWTTTVQPDSPYKGATEPYTELNAVVATLSTGPVGPSDMLGKLNKSLIMKSVNADGLILKPSKPATAIDDMIRRLAWSDFPGPDGEVWSTYSDFGGKNKYGIILVADLKEDYKLTPCMAGYQHYPPLMVFSARNPDKVMPLTDPQPLALSGCTKVDFCLYYASPIIEFKGKTVLIQGELKKWVPMSPQRVVDISISTDDIQVMLRGGSLEIVYFSFNVDGESQTVTCAIRETGYAVVSYALMACLDR